jgi:ABC-type multidrug transport system ATPase subunit
MTTLNHPKAVINIYIPGQPPRQIELTKNFYRIGRQADNDISIHTDVVSRQHATLEFLGSDWVYTDLNSSNGSFLNNSKVARITLEDGMTLQMGKNPNSAVTIAFRYAEQPVEYTERDTILEPRETTTGLVQIPSLQSSEKNYRVIGRGSDADIQLASPSVSRKHAALRAADPEWVLDDLDSKNGTFLNGKRVIRAQTLKTGDVIQISSFRLVYEGQGRVTPFAANNGLRLDGIDLTWETDNKRILDNVNISCYPREFIALVGGSGAGKTTLMKALSGILPEHSGKVTVEGDDLYKHYEAYRAMIGYVPQDDILHTDLTVEEALKYSAYLRLPSDISSAEIKKLIDKVLDQVELQGQRKTLIKKLSGGQRKRASIAVELLADPPLFFLDEPTSGLDPDLEYKMMKMLRKLAEGGKTIVLVTHATANIMECHQVAFMSQGRLVYYGPPQKAGEFFEVGSNSENFADIYSQISDAEPKLAVERAETWERKFRLSSYYKKFITDRLKTGAKMANGNTQPQNSGRRFSFIDSIYQFAILFARYWSLVLRDKTLRMILLFLMPVLAFFIFTVAEPNWLIGDTRETINRNLTIDLATAQAKGDKSATYMIVGDSQKLLFIMGLTAVMFGIFAAAYELVKERNIYGREKMVFLRLVPYLLSKIGLLGIFAALQCFLFLLVISLKVPLPILGVLFLAPVEIYITLLLAALTAICMGLFISAISPNETAVAYIIMAVLFLQISFAGVIFNFNEGGFGQKVSFLTLTRWSMEGLGTTVDLNKLEDLSQTRIQPDPVTKEVEVMVKKPSPDWKPITVASEVVGPPNCTTPVIACTVTENELTEQDKVEEMVKQVVTVKPDPVDDSPSYDFVINYDFTVNHLLQTWGILVFMSFIFFCGTLISLSLRKIT